MSNRRHGKRNKGRRRGRSPPQKVRVLPGCTQPGADAGRGGRRARGNIWVMGTRHPGDPAWIPAPALPLRLGAAPPPLPEPAEPGASCREVRPQVRRGTSVPEPAGTSFCPQRTATLATSDTKRVKNKVTATALAATMSDRSVCARHLPQMVPQSRGRVPQRRGSTARETWNWDLNLPSTSPRRRC